MGVVSTIDKHKKWVELYNNRIKELEKEISDIKTLLYKEELEIRDIEAGINVGDDIEWFEESCSRGCCGVQLEGKIVARIRTALYSIVTNNNREYEKRLGDFSKLR